MAGSGAPRGPLDPVQIFHALVTRRAAGARPGPGSGASQALTRDEALSALTAIPAAAVSEEDEGGTITVGKRADFTVLSADIMEIPEIEIPKARVVMTVVGGAVVFDRGSKNP
jgi:predicted amidohydrolase YtcJ